jgi:hypothetical protein
LTTDRDRSRSVAGNALAELERRFTQEALPLPPIPDELRSALRRLGPWTFGSRAVDHDLYDQTPFIAEWERGEVEDYLLLGHAGHGVNSYAMHYDLVRGPFAVFLQSAWGGAYTDADEARRVLAVRFAQIDQCLGAMEEATRAGLVGPGARIGVVVSDFYGSRWSCPVDGAAAKPRWQRTADALNEALEYLRGERLS